MDGNVGNAENAGNTGSPLKRFVDKKLP